MVNEEEEHMKGFLFFFHVWIIMALYTLLTLIFSEVYLSFDTVQCCQLSRG